VERLVIVRDFDPASERDWAERELVAAFGGRIQVRRGAAVDVLALPGLVAERDGERIGLALYDPGDPAGEAELAALVTLVRGAGAGSALVEALRERLPDRPIWVVTTNDNVDALRFYQRSGFRLRALRAGAVDETRRTLKPQIPATGAYGLPVRDELELVLPPRDLG
jgi:ribosomal protein S18 acetylase RimI-like enzyme